jgi:DNA repair ATPase RecN
MDTCFSRSNAAELGGAPRRWAATPTRRSSRLQRPTPARPHHHAASLYRCTPHLGINAAASDLHHAPSADAPRAAAAAPPPPTRTHLAELHIRDFALVAEQRVALRPGLNVITGESGSGKSVLVEALSQLLGAPAGDDLVRPPATTAVVEGLVAVAPGDVPAVIALLESLGVPARARAAAAGGLRLRREIVGGGGGGGGARSRCSINGAPTTLRVLREVGRALVDVNGQHAALAMRDPRAQLALLDRLGGTAAAAAATGAAWRRLQAARAQRRALLDLADEGRREALQALTDEVGAAEVEPGEDAALRRRLRELDARRSAAERCALVAVGIGGDGGGGGIVDALHDVEIHLRAVLAQEERLAAAEAQRGGGEGGGVSGGEDGGAAAAAEDGAEAAAALLQGAMAALSAAREALAEGEAAVERYARRYRFSQGDADAASARLQLLERLCKRHAAPSVDELLAAAAEAEAALDSFFQLEGRREEMAAELAALEAAAAAQAAALAAARRGAAARLRGGVESVLGELAMGGARFAVRLRWTACASGGDQVSTSTAPCCLLGFGVWGLSRGLISPGSSARCARAGCFALSHHSLLLNTAP